MCAPRKTALFLREHCSGTFLEEGTARTSCNADDVEQYHDDVLHIQRYTRQSWVETTICSSLAARGAFSTGVLVPVMWLVVWSIAWTGFAESAVKMAAKANANTSDNATLSAAGGWAAAVTVFEDAEVGNEPYLQHIGRVLRPSLLCQRLVLSSQQRATSFLTCAISILTLYTSYCLKCTCWY